MLVLYVDTVYWYCMHYMQTHRRANVRLKCVPESWAIMLTSASVYAFLLAERAMCKGRTANNTYASLPLHCAEVVKTHTHCHVLSITQLSTHV